MKDNLSPTLNQGQLFEIDGVVCKVTGIKGGELHYERDGLGLEESVELNAFMARRPRFLTPDGKGYDELTHEAAVMVYKDAPRAEQDRALRLEPHIRQVIFGTPELPGESPTAPGSNLAPEPSEGFNERLDAKVEELANSEFSYKRETLEKLIRAYRERGVAGLVRKGSGGRPVERDPRFDEAVEVVLARQLSKPGPRIQATMILAKVAELIATNERFKGTRIPSKSVSFEVVKRTLKWMGADNTHRKYQQSRANRPAGTFRKAHATMPGERVEIDATVLNVMVTDGTRMFRAHSVWGLDGVTRAAFGPVVAPSIGQPEVASLLLEMFTPKPSARPFSADAAYNQLGVDASHLAKFVPEAPEGASEAGLMIVPRVICIDRGREFDNRWLVGLAANLGFGIEFARPYTPTDKPHVERFFRTLESVLQTLPGYTGIDVRDRGSGLQFEPHELLTLAELETVLKAWVTRVYHHTPHSGLVVSEVKA
ncbi:MAG: hypothetical protein ROY82_08660 [Truepera sp.]|jgi:transposase InsO family protein|nr:hypothetical protein [Truepera sp.]